MKKTKINNKMPITSKVNKKNAFEQKICFSHSPIYLSFGHLVFGNKIQICVLLRKNIKIINWLHKLECSIFTL